MKAFSITEVSKTKGYDKILRSKAIAMVCEESRIDHQIILNSDDIALGLLEGCNHYQFDWRLFTDRLLELIRNSDITIVDADNIDAEFIQNIARNSKIPVFIDDGNNNNLSDGIIVDTSFVGDNQPEDASRLYYPKYSIVRPQFSQNKKENIQQRPENILIYFGEQDKSNIIPDVLKILVENLPDINKEIVVGYGFENTEHIWDLADDNTRVWLKPQENELAILMKNADIAIASAALPMLELADCATPSIIIAEDEKQFLKQSTIEENFVFAGFYMDEFFEHNVIEALQKIYSFDKRQEIYSKLKTKFCGNGTKRLIEFIINNH